MKTILSMVATMKNYVEYGRDYESCLSMVATMRTMLSMVATMKTVLSIGRDYENYVEYWSQL